MSSANKTLVDDLLKRGWTLDAHGNPTAPSRRRLDPGQRVEPVRVEGPPPEKKGGPGGLGGSGPGGARKRIPAVHGKAPVVLVTLIRLGPRRIDTGNLETGFKAIQDEIAASLQIDDADSRIEWEYGQMVSQIHDTIVLIRKFE